MKNRFQFNRIPTLYSGDTRIIDGAEVWYRNGREQAKKALNEYVKDRSFIPLIGEPIVVRYIDAEGNKQAILAIGKSTGKTINDIDNIEYHVIDSAELSEGIANATEIAENALDLASAATKDIANHLTILKNIILDGAELEDGTYFDTDDPSGCGLYKVYPGTNFISGATSLAKADYILDQELGNTNENISVLSGTTADAIRSLVELWAAANGLSAATIQFSANTVGELNEVKTNIDELSGATESFSAGTSSMFGTIIEAAGLNAGSHGSYPGHDETHIIKDATSLDNADVLLDAAVFEADGKIAELSGITSESAQKIESISGTVQELSANTVAADQALQEEIDEIGDRKILGVSAITVNTENGDSTVSLVINGEYEKVLTQNAFGLRADVSLVYDNDAQKIYLKGKNETVISEIDVTDFVKDGMLDTARLITPTQEWIDEHPQYSYANLEAGKPYLWLTFNTESEKEPADVFIALDTLVDVYTVSATSLNYLTIENYQIRANVDTENGLASKSSVDNVSAVTTNIIAAAGLNTGGQGTYPGHDETHIIKDATSLDNADVLLDSAVWGVSGMAIELSAGTIQLSADTFNTIQELSAGTIAEINAVKAYVDEKVDSAISIYSGVVEDYVENKVSGITDGIEDMIDDAISTYSGVVEDYVNEKIDEAMSDVESIVDEIVDEKISGITYNITEMVNSALSVYSGVVENYVEEKIEDAMGDVTQKIDSAISIYSGVVENYVENSFNYYSGVVETYVEEKISEVEGNVTDEINDAISAYSGIVEDYVEEKVGDVADSIDTKISEALANYSVVVEDYVSEEISSVSGSLGELSGSVIANELSINELSASVIDNEENIDTISGFVETLASDIITGITFNGTAYTIENQVASISVPITPGSVYTAGSGITIENSEVSINLAGKGDTEYLKLDGDGLYMTGVSVAINELSASVVSNETEISGLGGEISSLSASVIANTSDLSGIEANIDALSASVIANGTMIDTIDGNVSSLFDNVEVVSGDVISLSASVVSNKNDIAGLGSGIQDLGDDIAALSASVVTNGSNIAALGVDVADNGANIQILSGVIIDNELVVSSAINYLDTLILAVSGDVATNGNKINSLSGVVASLSSNTVNGFAATITGISYNDEPVVVTDRIAYIYGGGGGSGATYVAGSGITITGDKIQIKKANKGDVNILGLDGDGLYISGISSLSASVEANATAIGTANGNVNALSASVLSDIANLNSLSASVETNKTNVGFVSGAVMSLSAAVVTLSGNSGGGSNYTAGNGINISNTNVISARVATGTGDGFLKVGGTGLYISGVSAAISAVSSSLTELSASVESNQTKINAISGDVISLSASVTDNKTDIGVLSGIVETLSGSVDSNAGKITALSASVVSNASKINSIDGLSGAVQTLSASVNTSVTVVGSISGRLYNDEYVIAQAFNDVNDRLTKNYITATTANGLRLKEYLTVVVISSTTNVNLSITPSANLPTISSGTMKEAHVIVENTGSSDFNLVMPSSDSRVTVIGNSSVSVPSGGAADVTALITYDGTNYKIYLITHGNQSV